jgi:DNA-binding beta-propeller fold protein YncE
MPSAVRALPLWTLLLLAFLAAAAPGARAAVESEIVNSLKTGARPLDVAVSADGKLVFVLTDDGQVAIFSSDGSLMDKLNVGAAAERIAVDPEGERLYVTPRGGKRVDVVQIDFIRAIETEGAPAKGRSDAPVVLAVFSDFQ